jgi:hypothetical protein
MTMADYELLESDLEMFESDEALDEALSAFLESDEARRPRRRPVPTGRGAGYYRPKPSSGGVTQAQLQTALGKISKDVQANAAGIKTVGARVDSLAAEQKKQGDLLRKEIVERRKELGKLKSSLQMSSLIPLLMSKTVTVTNATTIGGAPVEKGTKLLIAPDTLGALLPMLLMGDGLGGGGDSGNTMILALALSGGL